MPAFRLRPVQDPHHTASVWAVAKRSRAFGLPGLILPPVDLGDVMDRVHSVIDRIQMHDSVERFCALGAEVRFGEPIFADEHVVIVDGKRIAAKNWIIATGLSPVAPPVLRRRERPVSFTHVAGYEAGIALTNAILHLPRKADYGKIGWCTYTDPEVASIGLNEKRAKKEGVTYRAKEEAFDQNDRALAEGETQGKIKMLVSPKGELLGCQIMGVHAGEIIHEWILAVYGGMKLSKIAGAVHVYPTVSEISKRVAGSLFAEKLFGDRAKSLLRFIFQLK